MIDHSKLAAVLGSTPYSPRSEPDRAQVEFGYKFACLAKTLAEWSQETFGSDSERGPTGALKHLAKETTEAIEAIGTNEFSIEMADCLLLVIDAARRGGVSPVSLINSAIFKMGVNMARKWPKPTDDNPVHHVK